MDNTNKALPRAILVFGAPGSGKTTFAERFSSKFHAAFYDLTEIEEKYKFSRRTVLKCIELIARTNTTLVIEGGLDTEKDRNEVKNVLRKAGYSPSLIWIQTDVGTIKMRLKMKHKNGLKARDEYERRIESMEAPTEIESPIVLSGKHTFETQLRHVLTQIA
ncbi:AAA family ATPase [Candidatus Saccharibacteria bacterium]|nr:AAA family ATPase [Candidatus Saccharibacteria bacterium]MBQ6605514.1 AAA family ATPase [Candidatus Saccharibacteria bacterium]